MMASEEPPLAEPWRAGDVTQGRKGSKLAARMLNAIGLMSGTSMDGIDAAILRTDGERIEAFGPTMTLPYAPEFRDRLRAVMGQQPSVWTAPVSMDLTRLHGESVQALLEKTALTYKPIDIIGFHGQTILHQPENRLTVQLGDGQGLALQLGAPIAWDFRSADVAAGGQGAPFVPLYHAALVQGRELPLAVVNIGGVANVTWIGGPEEILAFDTGPGNGPLDDWVLRHTGEPFDRDGALAAQGRAHSERVEQGLANPYFARTPPKSLDRTQFGEALAAGLDVADGAATLAEFTAQSIAAARAHFPRPAREWILCGGGRRNRHLVARLRALLAPASVIDCDELGWNGDALEAQAFAFLAVRVLRGLPLSLPTTTGVPYPMPGGRISRP